MNGFFLIDKPSGPTSHDIVRQVRRLCGGAKAGHSGTLDPLASGLLLCAVGDATRLLPFLPAEPKRYSFGITFGTETDTLDSEGKVTAQGGRLPGAEEIAAALPRFVGAITQTPPRFSAVRVDGERAYHLARANREFTLAGRTITIFALSLVKYEAAASCAALDVTCSGGTYVRSLVKDIAAALGTLGYASFIRRLGVGPFTVETAATPDAVAANVDAHIVPVHRALSSLPSVKLDNRQIEAVATGANIRIDRTENIVIAYDDKEEVAAVLCKDGQEYHPDKVFVRQ